MIIMLCIGLITLMEWGLVFRQDKTPQEDEIQMMYVKEWQENHQKNHAC